jgi:hypothetical protein
VWGSHFGLMTLFVPPELPPVNDWLGSLSTRIRSYSCCWIVPEFQCEHRNILIMEMILRLRCKTQGKCKTQAKS